MEPNESKVKKNLGRTLLEVLVSVAAINAAIVGTILAVRWALSITL